MPVQPTHPGVHRGAAERGAHDHRSRHVDHGVSGERPCAARSDQPVTITSFSDYERIFGGLHRDMTLSYAVRDFF
ncbi:MAG: hypothetical protein IPO99_19520 [Nitrospira sp.]|nr:hypothetical protein [Nitrospira sp.]